jgi:hypothetical protein
MALSKAKVAGSSQQGSSEKKGCNQRIKDEATAQASYSL